MHCRGTVISVFLPTIIIAGYGCHHSTTSIEGSLIMDSQWRAIRFLQRLLVHLACPPTRSHKSTAVTPLPPSVAASAQQQILDALQVIIATDFFREANIPDMLCPT
jgi:hypothetical protein